MLIFYNRISMSGIGAPYVYTAILACTKKEFSEKGYRDASLRVIARRLSAITDTDKTLW